MDSFPVNKTLSSSNRQINALINAFGGEICAEHKKGRTDR